VDGTATLSGDLGGSSIIVTQFNGVHKVLVHSKYICLIVAQHTLGIHALLATTQSRLLCLIQRVRKPSLASFPGPTSIKGGLGPRLGIPPTSAPPPQGISY
jgi:hypothetical protein